MRNENNYNEGVPMMKLTAEQVKQYREDGFIILDGVFGDKDLQPVIDAINGFIDERARKLQAEGKITELHEHEPFERRYALLYEQSKEIGAKMDIMQWRSKALFDFLHNDALLDVAESLLSSEITCNPIQHLRGKVPEASLKGEFNPYQNVPWHQDAGVTLEEADDSEIITFWLPLVDAVRATGCMELMSNVFREGLLEHQAEGGTTIVPAQLPNVEPVLGECYKGGLIVMNKYTPHRGTPNVSNVVRWTLDLRYQRTGEPTGRPFHPEFPVRSAKSPESVTRDYDTWCRRWEEALVGSAGKKLHRVK